MVTLEDRELFLRAVSDPASIRYKAEAPPVPQAKPRKLLNPDYDVKLDLHGLTVEQAEARVHACLMRCVELKKRRLLVVHGKGEGILRYEIRALLAGSSKVSQVQEVPPKLGGDGAVMAILRPHP